MDKDSKSKSSKFDSDGHAVGPVVAAARGGAHKKPGGTK